MKSAFYRISLCAAAPVALLSACKSVDVPKVPGVTPYRMVIQQGNYISQEMVAQLKVGMTKEQVRYVLGTPLVTDIFHADRWDYVFFREHADGKKEQRNLSVVFEKDRLARVIGDLMSAPGTAPAAGGFDSQQRSDTAPRPIGTGKPAAKPEAKPAAEPAQVEAPKPAPEATGQNWSTSSEVPPKPAPAPEPKVEAPKVEEKPAAAAPETQKGPDEPKERGFFGRMMEKIGL